MSLFTKAAKLAAKVAKGKGKIKKGGSNRSRSKAGKSVLADERVAKKALKTKSKSDETRQASMAKSAGVSKAFKAKEKAVEALESKIKGPLRFAPKIQQDAAKEKLQLLKNSMKEMEKNNFIKRKAGGTVKPKKSVYKTGGTIKRKSGGKISPQKGWGKARSL
jgi:hypothetical protein